MALDENGDWIQTPPDDPSNTGGSVQTQPSPDRVGTPGNPNYDNTTNQPSGEPVGGGKDPWGQGPDSADYGYEPGKGPSSNYGRSSGNSNSGGGNPNAPAFGQPSLNSDQITSAYQAAFGRPPTASELASEKENANKYGPTGILNSIAARTNNSPGSNQAGTATAASLGWAVPSYKTAGGATVAGRAATPNFTAPRGSQNLTNNPANTSPQFTDPSQQLLESYGLNRFNQLQNPASGSGSAMYESYAKELVDRLKAAPYSATDEATIKAKSYDAISLDEQTTTQQWMEEMSRRGIPPSSGPALAGLQHIKDQFNQLRATVDQQFASNAITMGQNNRTQALDVLGNLATSENTRLNAAEHFARIPYDLGNDAFNMNLQAVNAGGMPSTNASNAISLATAMASQQNQQVQNQIALAVETYKSSQTSAEQKQRALNELMAFLGGM